MPTFYCPRCRGTDAYYAPRQVGVNVRNWDSSSHSYLPNSTQWQTVNRALCRQCGEIIQVTYSRQEKIDQFKKKVVMDTFVWIVIGAFLYFIYQIVP